MEFLDRFAEGDVPLSIIFLMLFASVAHADGSMQIVSHLDDDTFFMNPAISKAIAAATA